MAVDIERPHIHLSTVDNLSHSPSSTIHRRPPSPLSSQSTMRNRDASPTASRPSPTQTNIPTWTHDGRHLGLGAGEEGASYRRGSHSGGQAGQMANGMGMGSGPGAGTGMGMANANGSAMNGHANGNGHHHHHQRGSSSDTKETHLSSPISPTFHPSNTHNHSQYNGHPHSHNHSPYNKRDASSSPSALLTSALSTLRSFLPRSTPGLPTSSQPFDLKSGPRISLTNANSPRTSSLPPIVWPDTSTLRFVALCALWYGSSAMSSNTGKSILNRFRYPVTLTFVQFGFVAFYCVCFVVIRERMASASQGKHGHHGKLGKERTLILGIKRPNKQALYGTTVMSFFQIAGHVFSSMAIARVPVSTVHTIKALSPLFTVASYALLFGVRYSAPTYTSLFPLTIGVMLACSFDLRANAFGFLCALGSTIIFVSQNIFSKKLLPKESSTPNKGIHAAPSETPGKLDKLHLLLYSSGMAFGLMIPIWMYTDAFSLLSPSIPSLTSPDIPITPLLFSFFLNGTVHFGQNLLAFSILARTSPVTYSIASLVKRIAVICIAIVWFGQTVHGVQGLGIMMTFGGLWMYNRAKGDVDRGERKRGQVERANRLMLPTTKGDVMALDGITPPPSGRTTPIGQRSPVNAMGVGMGGMQEEMEKGFPHSPHAHTHAQLYGHPHLHAHGGFGVHASSAYPHDDGAVAGPGPAIGGPGARSRTFSIPVASNSPPVAVR